MNEKVLLGQFEIPIILDLDCFQLEEFRQSVNEFHYGKKKVPLKAKISQELKDAHWCLNAAHKTSLKVNYFSDGSFEIV